MPIHRPELIKPGRLHPLHQVLLSKVKALLDRLKPRL